MASFSSELKKAIKNAGITQKKLAKETGISEKMISDYVHGVNPTPEKRKILEMTLNIPPIKEAKPVVKYPLEEAAYRLGMSKDALKICLRNDTFKPQIGVAVNHGKSYSYMIFENRLNKYLEGADF